MLKCQLVELGNLFSYFKKVLFGGGLKTILF